jgi:hypothetical protein
LAPSTRDPARAGTAAAAAGPVGRGARSAQRLLAGLAVGAMALLAALPAQAGAWGRDTWSVYSKVTFRYYTSNDSFTRGIRTGLKYDAFSWDLYSEIGLPYRFSFLFDLPYVAATNEAGSGFVYHNHTTGDGRVELDYRLLDSIALSLGFEAKVPLYQVVEHQGTEGIVHVDGEAYPTTNFPEVGDGNVDLTSKVMLGYSFYPFPAWAEATVGYRARLGGFADGLYGSLGGGLYVWPEHIALGVYSEGIVNVQSDPHPDVQATREYLSLSGYVLVTAAPWVPALSLSLSAGGVLLAENSGTGQDYSVALAYSF